MTQDTIKRARNLADSLADSDCVTFSSVQTVIRELALLCEQETTEVSRLEKVEIKYTNLCDELNALTAEVTRLNEQPRITPAMAQMILDAAEAHIEGDHDEVYHQIRIFAHELTDDPFDSWKAMKATASGRQAPAFAIERSHEAVDAFWKVWMEVGEPHKHGVYESTWMSFKAAMVAGGKDQRTTAAMSEMIEKASAAIKQTACPKCSQQGLIECEHINPSELDQLVATADSRQEPRIIEREGPMSGPWWECSDCGDELYQHGGDGGVHLECGQCGHEWYEGEYQKPDEKGPATDA